MVLDFGDFPFGAFAAAVRRVTRFAAQCVSFRFVLCVRLTYPFSLCHRFIQSILLRPQWTPSCARVR